MTMIALKEQKPETINLALQNETYLLEDNSLSLKEKELLLKLFINFLPASTVISHIHKNSPSSSVFVSSLCNLSIPELIDNYINVENGLLDMREYSIFKSIALLFNSILDRCEVYQRKQLISFFFDALIRDDANCQNLLECIYNYMDSIVYLLVEKELQLLSRLYQNTQHKELVLSILYRSVFRSVFDVQFVRNAFPDVDDTKYYFF